MVPDEETDSKANRFIETPLFKRNQLYDYADDVIGERTQDMSFEE